jgi:Anthrax toxin LF subunit
MSADLERKSGILAKHVGPIANTAREVDAFILIRKTNLDATRLIGMGYATKSMDIHDKSSDWGPMAGFVPCDPAFSKVAAVMPGGQQEHEHGDAKKTQLFLTDALKKDLIKNDKIAKAGAEDTFTATTQVKDVQKATLFKLEKRGGSWFVSYAMKQGGGQRGDWQPLMVWAYKLGGVDKPVTGDYDLWMVAPHMSHLTSHGFNIGRAGARDNKDSHGASSSSLFILSLITKLNKACHRDQNPVFQHGAEAQNYGFTQQLDDELAMFVPGSADPRVIERARLANAIADMSNRGYLPIWNKRYGEADPNFGGKSEQDRKEKMEREFADSAEKLANAKGADAQATQEIKKFHDTLLARLSADDTSLAELTDADFPAGAGSLNIDLSKIQRDLQRAVVGATVGTGATDFNNLAEFYANNFQDLQTLFAHWRGKGGSSFGLAPVSRGQAPTVDPSRITGQGSTQQGTPGILDRIRKALAG